MKIHHQPKQGKLYDLLCATGRKVATTIGFGGAKGGGKSAGADDCAIELAGVLGPKYPGLKITIVRRVYDDLKKNHIDPILANYPELREYYRAGDKEIVFDSHAKIIFAYAETKEDVKRKFLGGFESGFIFVDEAQQFDQEELQWIHAACRWTNRKFGIPEGLCKTVLLFNPGGVGSTYIRRIFWTKEYEGEEKAYSFAFMHVFGWDNYEWFRGQVDIDEIEFYRIPSYCQNDVYDENTRCCRAHIFITQTSEGRKYNAFPPSIRAGYLWGSFDHFEGQYFAGAWDQSKCVISTAATARIVQPWWTHWMSLDWGWAGPPRPHYSVCLWFAIGKLAPSALWENLRIQSDYPLDVVVVYRAMHACLTPEPELARQIVSLTPKAERDVMARFFVDGSVFSKDRRSENTTADLMQPIIIEAGMPSFVAADKDRVGGWRQLYNAFLRTCKARSAPVEEEQEGPLMFISAECVDLCSSVPKVICDVEKNPHDVLKTESIEDDYLDDLRYGYKSMQNAQWEAPIEVRRRELYDSYDVRHASETAGGPDETMTNVAMALRRFDSDERNRYKRVKRRR